MPLTLQFFYFNPWNTARYIKSVNFSNLSSHMTIMLWQLQYRQRYDIFSEMIIDIILIDMIQSIIKNFSNHFGEKHPPASWSTSCCTGQQASCCCPPPFIVPPSFFFHNVRQLATRFKERAYGMMRWKATIHYPW